MAEKEKFESMPPDIQIIFHNQAEILGIVQRWLKSRRQINPELADLSITASLVAHEPVADKFLRRIEKIVAAGRLSEDKLTLLEFFLQRVRTNLSMETHYRVAHLLKPLIEDRYAKESVEGSLERMKLGFLANSIDNLAIELPDVFLPKFENKLTTLLLPEEIGGQIRAEVGELISRLYPDWQPPKASINLQE